CWCCRASRSIRSLRLAVRPRQKLWKFQSRGCSTCWLCSCCEHLNPFQMSPERFLRAHFSDHSITFHLVDGASGDADVYCHVPRLPRPIDPRNRLLREFG